MFLPSCFSIFFICDDLPFINTIQKTLKPSKKIFQCPGWMRKNFIPGNFSWRVAAETWDAKEKGWLEKQQCSKHLRHIAIEKDILSELNRCIFQIPLKYIKLVIPKILFIRLGEEEKGRQKVTTRLLLWQVVSYRWSKKITF